MALSPLDRILSLAPRLWPEQSAEVVVRPARPHETGPFVAEVYDSNDLGSSPLARVEGRTAEGAALALDTAVSALAATRLPAEVLAAPAPGLTSCGPCGSCFARAGEPCAPSCELDLGFGA